MNQIKIETVNGNKLINKRNLAEILNNFSHEEKEYDVIKSLFIEITSEDDMINKLKNFKNKFTPVEMLLIIKVLCNVSVNEANPILEKVLS